MGNRHQRRAEAKGRVRPAVGPVPSWASFLSRAEYAALMKAVEDECQRRHMLVKHYDGYFVAAQVDGSIVQCGLENLAVKCGTAKVDEYPALVREHFERLLGAPLELPPAPTDFSEVAPYLRVRVMADAALTSKSKSANLTRPLAPGLQLVLMLEFPQCLASVSREIIEPFGRSDDELFRIGIEHVGKLAVEREPLDLPGGLRGFCLLASHFFVSSQVLHLAQHLGHHYPLGALVGLPTRNMLYCLPLQSGMGLESLEAIKALAFMVDGAYREFEGREGVPLCRSLFWWRDGALTAFPTAVGPEGVVVVPPQAFLDEVLTRPAGASLS